MKIVRPRINRVPCMEPLSRPILCVLLCACFALLPCLWAQAAEFDLWGKPVTIHGYLSQSAGIGIGGEHFDTQKRLQSAVFQGLIEGAYEPADTVRMFASGRLNADWAYPMLGGNTLWKEKGFNESRDRLYVFDDGRDLLNEAHVTWRPDRFYLRLGKQIVRWGETDGFRLMDQINPVDQRRGLADVEFETTILPLWLARGEYALRDLPAWCQSLSFQGIFNPNVQFRHNESIQPGNTAWGIWAPGRDVPLGQLYPLDYAHLGSADARLKEPGGSEGFEYAFRVRSIVRDTTLTLNYYYGRDKDPVVTRAGPSRTEISPYDGRLIVHPFVQGFYPLFRFLGGTMARDIDALQWTALGGVAPVLRLEAFYAFSKTFASDRDNVFVQHDEVRWAAGIDWKVKINFLNPGAFFTISPQFYQRRIIGYPGGDSLTGPGGEPLRENNYQASLLISTAYMGGKLQPSLFWLRNVTEQADFVKLQLAYDWSEHYRYMAGMLFFDGQKTGRSYEQFSNKDQVYFTASYRF